MSSKEIGDEEGNEYSNNTIDYCFKESPQNLPAFLLGLP